MSAELLTWMAGMRRRAQLHGALRGFGLGAGASAVLAGAGAPLPVALLAVAGAVGGALRAPREGALAARVDRIGGLNDALACAWDHRAGETPVLVAQRRVALRFAKNVPMTECLPRPSLAWGLGLLLWVWPLLSPPAARWGSASSPVETTAADDSASEAARAAARGALSPATATRAGDSGEGLSKGQGTPSAPTGEEEPGEGEGRGVPSAEASAQAPGVGARAGELSGGKVRPGEAAAVGSGTARALTVSRGAGETAQPDEPSEAATALGAPPSIRDDTLSDPARPYPPADAPLIAAYFDARDRTPRPAAPKAP